MLRAGQAVQQSQHHTRGSHQAPHRHRQKLLVSLVGAAHTQMLPSAQEHPHASPRSSLPHCASTGKVRKAQHWLKHPKKSIQHPLLAVSARALEQNKGDWELAHTHVLVCTHVLSVLPGLSLLQGIAEAMAGPMAAEPCFAHSVASQCPSQGVTHWIHSRPSSQIATELEAAKHLSM